MLQSVTECYRVLQSITEYFRVLQSITETNLAHLLGPIFGLVLCGIISFWEVLWGYYLKIIIFGMMSCYRNLHHNFHPLIIFCTYFTATGIQGRSLWTACSGSASSSSGSSWSLLCSGANKGRKKYPIQFPEHCQGKNYPFVAAHLAESAGSRW